MKESIDFIKIKDYAVINLNNMIYVKAKLIADDGEEKEILSFGPFTIHPDYQRKGYGRRLLEHSFEVAKEMGYDTVAIWGNPENYACYGFKNCKRFHVCLEENVFPVALMVKELEEGILADKSWKFMESPAHQMDESGQPVLWKGVMQGKWQKDGKLHHRIRQQKSQASSSCTRVTITHGVERS